MASIVNGMGVTPDSLARTLHGIDRAARRIPFKSRKGLIRAGLYIQGESQKRTPVDTGNLRASAFTVWGPGKGTNFSPEFKQEGTKKIAQRDSQGRFAKSKVSSRRREEIAALEAGHAEFILAQSSDLVGDVLEGTIEVRVGYGAYYALFVHEKGVSRSQRGSKFLERALMENRAIIIRFIREEITSVGA